MRHPQLSTARIVINRLRVLGAFRGFPSLRFDRWRAEPNTF